MRLWEHSSSCYLGDDDDLDGDDGRLKLVITRLVLVQLGSMTAQMKGAICSGFYKDIFVKFTNNY